MPYEDSSASDLSASVDNVNDLLQTYSVVVDSDSQLSIDCQNLAVSSFVLIFALGALVGISFFRIMIRGAYVRSF